MKLSPIILKTIIIFGIAELSYSIVNVSPSKSLIWGPGLQSSFNVPVRYFFIQAVDEHGNKFVDSESLYSIQILSENVLRFFPDLLT